MRRLGSLAIGLVLVVTALGETRRLEAGGPRPVFDAIEQLSVRHGWAICYEEAYPRFAGDAHEGHLKPGALRFEYDPAAGCDEALARALAAYAKRQDRTATFRVVRRGARRVVKAARIRDERGQWVGTKTALDYPVTLRKGEWPLLAALDEMGRQLSLHTGFRVWMTPAVASNGLMQGTAVFASEGEDARTALAHMLAHARHPHARSQGWDTDWQVICGFSYGCSLNLVRSRPPGIMPPPPPPAWPAMGPLNRPQLPVR